MRTIPRVNNCDQSMCTSRFDGLSQKSLTAVINTNTIRNTTVHYFVAFFAVHLFTHHNVLLIINNITNSNNNIADDNITNNDNITKSIHHLQQYLYNTSSVPEKKYHVLLRSNSSKTDEPSNDPKYSLEPPRSGGVHTTKILKIGPKLVAHDEFKEKKYDLGCLKKRPKWAI